MIEQNGESVHETRIGLNQFQGPVRVSCEWSGRGPYVASCKPLLVNQHLHNHDSSQ